MKTTPSNNENTFKRGLFTAFYAVFILVFLLISTAKSWLPAIGHWFFVQTKVANADVIVVLAGGGTAMVIWAPELRSLGPYLAATAHVILAGLLMVWRFESGHWRKIDLLHRGEAQATGTHETL